MGFTLKTYPELYNAMKASVIARFPGAFVSNRSLLATLLHAAATQDAEIYAQMAALLDAFDYSTSTGEDLDRRAYDYGLFRLQPTLASGFVSFSDANFATKQAGVLDLLTPAGASTLQITAGHNLPDPAVLGFGYNVIIEREGAGREIVPVLSKAGDVLTLGSPTTQGHALGVSVIRSTVGVDRVIALGTEVYVPPLNPDTEAIAFETTASATLYDGDVVVNNVPVRAFKVGAQGTVGGNRIRAIRNKPFASAEVTNLLATGGGRDYEQDRDFQNRISRHIQSLSRGVVAAIESYALQVTDGTKAVFTAKTDQPVWPGIVKLWIEDGTGTLTYDPTSKTGYEALVYDAEPGEARGAFQLWPLIRGSVQLHKDLERGEATAVGIGTLTDASKTWAVSAYAGLILVDDNAQMWVITDNTATQLTGLGPIPPAPGTPSLGGYAIFDPTAPLVLFDVADMPLVAPTASDDVLVNYSNGQVELNPLKYPTGLDEHGCLVAYDYQYASGLVREVARVLLGDPTDLTNYPGVKAAGVYLEIKIPTTQNTSFQLQIVAENGYLESTLAVLVKEKVLTYVNALGIGDNVILSEIVRRVKSIQGIKDVVILAPANNLVVLAGFQVKTDTSLISVV